MLNVGNSNQDEMKRLAALEAIRTPENSHIINAARISGASVGDTAIKIVNSMIQEDESTDEIIGYMNEIVNRRNGIIRNTIRQDGPYSYFDTDTALSAEEHDAIRVAIEEAKSIYKQRGGTDQI